jgi:uncharacterized cupin superfamily protein
MKRQIMFVLMSLALVASASAQEKPRILRYDPKGVGDWEEKGEAGASKTYYYYRSAADKDVASGVWSSNTFSGKLRKASNTEVIHLLKGSVTFEDKNGKETVFKAGDTVLIPRGTEFAWKKSSDMKEYWAIFDRAGANTPAPAGTPMFQKLEPDGPAGKGMTPSKDGKTKDHEYFKGPDGSVVGVWETQPMKTDFFDTQHAELMMFLKGNVTLTTSDGQVERFKAGDVALVPKGIKYKWESDTTRKYYVIFDGSPSARSSEQQ